MFITDGLNDRQREAVTTGTGPVLVLAGPGSGKTRVLTYRVAYLIQEMRVPAPAIMAVTFTNKAAEEMRERVAHLLGDKRQANRLTMGTFHSLGLGMLRAERKALGYPKGFAVYDQADQLGVVREVLRSLKDVSRDGERRWDVKAILTRISLAKNGFVAPEDVRYRQRTTAERVNARLKDEFGGRFVRVRGHAKVTCHLMFGLLALTVDQLMRLVPG